MEVKLTQIIFQSTFFTFLGVRLVEDIDNMIISGQPKVIFNLIMLLYVSELEVPEDPNLTNIELTLAQ